MLKIHAPCFEPDHVLNIAYNVLTGGQALDGLDRLEVFFETGDENPRAKYEEREQWTRRVETFLQEKGKAGTVIRIEPTRECQSYVLKAVEPDHPLSLWMGRLYPEKGQGGIMGLRNKSRVGHGFRSVSEKALKETGWKGGSQEVVTEACRAAEAVLGPLPELPLSDVHQRILETV